MSRLTVPVAQVGRLDRLTRLRGAQRYLGPLSSKVGAFILLSWAALALIGPLLWPYDPNATSPDRLVAPNWEHPLGTDRFGRDIAARVLAGARVSLSVGVVAVAVSTILGSSLGLVSGYFGGRVDVV